MKDVAEELQGTGIRSGLVGIVFGGRVEAELEPGFESASSFVLEPNK